MMQEYSFGSGKAYIFYVNGVKFPSFCVIENSVSALCRLVPWAIHASEPVSCHVFALYYWDFFFFQFIWISRCCCENSTFKQMLDICSLLEQDWGIWRALSVCGRSVSCPCSCFADLDHGNCMVHFLYMYKLHPLFCNIAGFIIVQPVLSGLMGPFSA